MTTKETGSDSLEKESFCVSQTLEEAKMVLKNVDRIQLSLNELNGNVEKHNNEVKDMTEQLDDLNGSVLEMENFILYLNWIQKVEDLR